MGQILLVCFLRYTYFAGRPLLAFFKPVPSPTIFASSSIALLPWTALSLLFLELFYKTLRLRKAQATKTQDVEWSLLETELLFDWRKKDESILVY